MTWGCVDSVIPKRKSSKEREDRAESGTSNERFAATHKKDICNTQCISNNLNRRNRNKPSRRISSSESMTHPSSVKINLACWSNLQSQKRKGGKNRIVRSKLQKGKKKKKKLRNKLLANQVAEYPSFRVAAARKFEKLFGTNRTFPFVL